MIAWYLPVLSVYLQQNAIVYLTCECNIESKTRKKILGLPLIISGRFREEKKLQSLLPLNQWVLLRLLYVKNIWFEVLIWPKRQYFKSWHNKACLQENDQNCMTDQSEQQHAKKVVCDSLGLVDFAITLVNSVLNLPTIGKWVFWVNSNYRSRTVINPAHQIFSG